MFGLSKRRDSLEQLQQHAEKFADLYGSIELLTGQVLEISRTVESFQAVFTQQVDASLAGLPDAVAALRLELAGYQAQTEEMFTKAKALLDNPSDLAQVRQELTELLDSKLQSIRTWSTDVVLKRLKAVEHQLGIDPVKGTAPAPAAVVESPGWQAKDLVKWFYQHHQIKTNPPKIASLAEKLGLKANPLYAREVTIRKGEYVNNTYLYTEAGRDRLLEALSGIPGKRQLSLQELPVTPAFELVPDPEPEAGETIEAPQVDLSRNTLRVGSVRNMGLRGEQKVQAIAQYLQYTYGIGYEFDFDYKSLMEPFKVSERRARELMLALAERGYLKPCGVPRIYSRIMLLDKEPVQA